VEKIERLEKEAVATQRTSDILLKVTESGYAIHMNVWT